MVEHVNYPDQATSLLGPDINVNSAAANTGFAVRQRVLIQSPDPKGSFQCAISMRRIFGFTDDYTKVTYGMRDTYGMQLIRKDDNDALFRTAAAGVGKVVLSKRAWVVPIVQPNDVLKLYLYKSIAANNNIAVGFRRRSLYLKQHPPSGDWALALHQKSHGGYWLDCK